MLYFSVSDQILKWVFPREINMAISTGTTIIDVIETFHTAIREGRSSTVDTMLRNNKLLKFRTDIWQGVSPMACATLHGQEAVQNVLKKHGLKTLECPQETLTAREILYGLEIGNPQLFERWVEAHRKKLNTSTDNILGLATAALNVNAVKCLLQNGADPNFVMDNGKTPFSMIVDDENSYHMKDRLAIVGLMIENNADVLDVNLKPIHSKISKSITSAREQRKSASRTRPVYRSQGAEAGVRSQNRLQRLFSWSRFSHRK